MHVSSSLWGQNAPEIHLASTVFRGMEQAGDVS